MQKIIYDLCGGTGAWSKPYKEAGYIVRLIDLVNYEDIRLLKKPIDSVHGVLAAPPCTNLCNGGARYWKEKGDVALLEALAVVDACLRFIIATKPKFWVLENPRGRLVHYLGPPIMYFNPCDYGDAYIKKTALWGQFNPPGKWNPIKPIHRGQFSQDVWNRKHKGISFGKKRRAAIRSITPVGFARAFFEANP